MWYHYNCDGLNDTGWGCVHRSYQNALHLFNHRISMEHLVQRFGNRWIEPALLRACIPSGFKTEFLLWFDKPQDKKRMLCTKPEDYDQIVPSQFDRQLFTELFQLANEHVFVADNGTHAYCIFFSDGWKLLDPHVNQANDVLTVINDLPEWLARSSLWMILAIAPKNRRVTFADPLVKLEKDQQKALVSALSNQTP